MLLFVSDLDEIDLPFKQLFLGAGIQSVCSRRMEPPNQSSKWMIENNAWGCLQCHTSKLFLQSFCTQKNSIPNNLRLFLQHTFGMHPQVKKQKQANYIQGILLWTIRCAVMLVVNCLEKPIGKSNQHLRPGTLKPTLNGGPCSFQSCTYRY